MPVFSCSRSLYIDWRMVVVVGGGDILHYVEREGGRPGGELSGNMSEGGCRKRRAADYRVITR